MATITSAQTGNFNSASTWVGGVVPVDNDSFIINYGHVVTLNNDQRVSNGYNDSNVRGKLIITSSGKLRMNGILKIDNPTLNTVPYNRVFFNTTGFGPAIPVTFESGAVVGKIYTTSAHCFSNGTPIRFATNGTLPVGITAGTTYYVSNTELVSTYDEGYNDNYRFRLTTVSTGGGTNLNFNSTSQSGSHTVQAIGYGGGFLRMEPGSKLEIRGTNADQHRLEIADNYTTMEIEGDNPNPQTVVADDTINSEAFIAVQDSTTFRSGDWITVYTPKRSAKPNGSPAAWMYNYTDEGMWIHDIDSVNDRIYMRHFVGPECLIVSASSTSIIVNDASVMRVGYKIIFGTGANRNVKTITNINYNTNTLTVDSSITGSVIGQTIYQTGLEKFHQSGDIVIRLAAVLTADSNQGTNTITVNNTNGFNVGDLILVPVNDPNRNNATSWDNVMDYTISAIDTNTNVITLSRGFTNALATLQRNAKVGVGGIVVNLTRSTKITAPEGTTYGTAQHGCIAVAYSVGDAVYQRRVRIVNTEINVGANTNNVYGCIQVRGHQSYDDHSYGGYTSYFDGNSIYCVNRTSYSNTGYLWEQHRIAWRNNVSYNSGSYAFYSYGTNKGWFNNLAIRAYAGFQHEGTYGALSRMEYNYGIRCSNLWAHNQWNASDCVFRHNYGLFGDFLFRNNYQSGLSVINKCYFDFYLYRPSTTRINIVLFLNSYLGNSWDVTNFQTGGVYNDSININSVSWNATYPYQNDLFQPDTISGFNNLKVSLFHNFKYNSSLLENETALRIYDNNEQAWRVWPDRDDYGLKGFINSVVVPANTTVFIRGSVKTATNNTNYPFIYAKQQGGSFRNPKVNAFTSSSNANSNLDYIDFNGRAFNSDYLSLAPNSAKVTAATGFVDVSSVFTSASSSGFEEKTLTLPPMPFDYILDVGIVCFNNGLTSRLGWYEKDLEIYLDGAKHNTESNFLEYLMTRNKVTNRSTLNQLKTILGG